jgi:hypothetical protein
MFRLNYPADGFSITFGGAAEGERARLFFSLYSLLNNVLAGTLIVAYLHEIPSTICGLRPKCESIFWSFAQIDLIGRGFVDGKRR